MKKAILALAMSATFVSCGASATGKIDITNPFDHATRTELKAEATTRTNADKNLQSQIDQKGYDINTQAKVSVGINADLQASKAAGAAAYNQVQSQIGQTNGAVKAVDDKLNSAIGAGQAAYGQVQGQIGDLSGKVDNAVAAGAAELGKTNEAVKAVDGKANAINGDLQASKAAGVAAYTELKGTQGRQQTQINAVQGAAQTANDRASNLEVRADTVEGAVRETNAQVAVTDARSINNAVRLDGVETGVAGNTAAIKTTNGVVAAQGATISQHTTQISNLDSRTTTNTTNIAKNTSDIKAANAVAGQHTTQLANHETRITSTEKTVAGQGATLSQHTEALQQNAAQWQVQSQVNNEYGTRLDAQDAMSSRFAGDIGNLKSQVAGMNDRINSADRKAEKALNAAAGALSVASIQFSTEVDAGFQVGAGVATLAGKNAAAIGVGGAVNKNWFVSGYATQAGSASGAAASVTYSMGR